MARLTDVNTTDVPGAIALGCEAMQRIFNPDDEFMPYFDARVWPRDQAGFAFEAPYTEAHVAGRHLLALLEAEDAIGASVDDEAIARHRKAAFLCFRGGVKLPLSRRHIGGPSVVFADHNLREAFHGLYALTRFRGDDQARDLAEQCIQAVMELWDSDRGWDVDRLTAAGVELEQRTFIWGPARAIGSLVKYHQATGSSLALELALILAEKAMAEFYLPDGRFDHQRFGTHTHSATCTLSGLARLADLLGDGAMMQRVRAFYDHGLAAMRDDIGWVREHVGAPDRNPDRGESNNTGDVIETALILGRHGWPEHHADAERIVRCHLLPSQLRDISFIQERENPEGLDALRDVASRARGTWGFPAPYGHQPVGMPLIQFCLDIVGGAVSSLCEVWRESVLQDATGCHVALWLDRDDEVIRIESPYRHDVMTITPRRTGPLWVRLAPWLDPAGLAIDAPGRAPVRRGAHLLFASPEVGQPIALRFDLPRLELTLRHAERDIRVELRGDEVTAMDDFGADFTYFPSLAHS